MARSSTIDLTSLPGQGAEIVLAQPPFLSIAGGMMSATGSVASENRRLSVVNPGTPLVVLEGTVSDD